MTMRIEGRRTPSAISVALAALLGLSLVVPAASAQDADEGPRRTSLVTFFAHVFDTNRFAPMPMNTEFPAGENDFSAGYGGNCHEAAPPGNPAIPTCEEYAFNEAWFVSSAGFVDIRDDSEFAFDKLHNERGLTKPIVFDTATDVTAVFYMSADAQGWPSVLCNPNAGGLAVQPDLDDVPWIPWCFNWDPGLLPQWQIEATLYAAVLGEHGSGASEAADIDDAYQTGKLEVLAQGLSAPVDIVSIEALGYPTVWEFPINLGKVKASEIPKEKSLIWRVQWWALVGGQKMLEDNTLAWNVNSGEFFPPRVVLPVKNAFDVELVLPQFVHGKLVLHGILNTPWGSYDADPESVKLTIASEDGSRSFEPSRIQAFADYSVAHGGHYKPVNVTYVWDYRGDKLSPGTWTATIEAANHQNSARGSCEAVFRIHPDLSGEVVRVGRCGYVSEGAEAFARRQAGEPEGPSGLLDLPLRTLTNEAERATPALPLLAFLVALGYAAARRRAS